MAGVFAPAQRSARGGPEAGSLKPADVDWLGLELEGGSIVTDIELPESEHHKPLRGFLLPASCFLELGRRPAEPMPGLVAGSSSVRVKRSRESREVAGQEKSRVKRSRESREVAGQRSRGSEKSRVKRSRESREVAGQRSIGLRPSAGATSPAATSPASTMEMNAVAMSGSNCVPE